MMILKKQIIQSKLFGTEHKLLAFSPRRTPRSPGHGAPRPASPGSVLLWAYAALGPPAWAVPGWMRLLRKFMSIFICFYVSLQLNGVSKCLFFIFPCISAARHILAVDSNKTLVNKLIYE